jgi:hypothetical protein
MLEFVVSEHLLCLLSRSAGALFRNGLRSLR